MEDPCKRTTQWLQSLQNTTPRAPPLSSLDHSNITNFFESFCLKGIQIKQITHGRLLCTFTVPPRLVVCSTLSRSLPIFSCLFSRPLECIVVIIICRRKVGIGAHLL
uniref:Uncharacterized protein n=1 Tax=Picea sitchensis TaxID=3332 RepID=D5ACA6_PICSI|nr:unknown [Picea sitchensis]